MWLNAFTTARHRWEADDSGHCHLPKVILSLVVAQSGLLRPLNFMQMTVAAFDYLENLIVAHRFGRFEIFRSSLDA